MSRPPKLTAAPRRDIKPEKSAPAPRARPPCAPLALECERRPHPDPGPAVDCVRWACACGDRGYWLGAAYAAIAETAGRSHVELGTEGSNPPPDEDV